MLAQIAADATVERPLPPCDEDEDNVDEVGRGAEDGVIVEPGIMARLIEDVVLFEIVAVVVSISGPCTLPQISA